MTIGATYDIMWSQGKGNRATERGQKIIADSEAKRQWMKDNTTHIGIKLNNRTDSDILEALEGKQKQTEIKRLLRIALQSEKQ